LSLHSSVLIPKGQTVQPAKFALLMHAEGEHDLKPTGDSHSRFSPVNRGSLLLSSGGGGAITSILVIPEYQEVG